ncbi:MAG: porin [Beijerinckiaceae bacterium]|nr:MAG: porin [Beijerinckiaceae bacterium]
MKARYFIWIAALSILAAFAPTHAFATDLPTIKGPLPAPVPSWWSTFSVSGDIDSGITFNPDLGSGNVNFGRLFDDKANEPLLNQVSVVVQRPLDSSAKTIDFGFRVQLLYGSDARYSHYLGECDYCIDNINQFDVLEAWGAVHLPYVFSGGVDIKVGQFATLLGYEPVNAPDSPFYSHTYIFNFGLPFKDTGIMTISHVSPMLDVYAGAITGENTSIGWNSPAFGDPGDNNNAPAFEGGLTLNLLNGKLTINADTNIGPENANTPLGAAACACNPNSAMRFLNDINASWKATDKLTLAGEANYVHDDALGGVDAYGFAGYALYQLSDWLLLKGRAEVFRDNNNFFVAAFPGNFDLANVEHGYPSTAYGAPAATTYFEVTGGVTITPVLPKGTPYLKSLIIRPEVRYDAALNGTTPFANGTKSSGVTFASDVILKF